MTSFASVAWQSLRHGLRRATSLYTREALVRCEIADRTVHRKVHRSAPFISSTNWNLLNFYWIINNYLFTIFAMICFCRRSCPIMLCKIYTFSACQKETIIIWFLWKNNFSRTIDKTIYHFCFTPRTFHTTTLPYQIWMFLIVSYWLNVKIST